MSFAARYSPVDRLLHGAAFAGLGLQRGVADLEDRLFAADFAAVGVDRPVFVTSLPRAGTTLLLELLTATGAFTTHTYRRMPFVLCPLLWWRVSRGFGRSVAPAERAHGDGMTVGADSVEAFEEVVWRAFWPDHYRADRVVPWDAGEEDRHGEFEAFFVNHIRKIVALGDRAADAPRGGRYVSKNNANIARLGLLGRLFPDATIVVPVRAPGAHVASLRRQHANFLEMHRREPFARRYMEWIGHLEFGEALRPIDFAGWLDAPGAGAGCDPSGPDFWLAYWCAAYETALADAPAGTVFVSYDRLRGDPAAGLARLADAVGLEDPGRLTGLAERLRAPTTPAAGAAADGDPALAARAGRLHDRLLERAIV